MGVTGDGWMRRHRALILLVASAAVACAYLGYELVQIVSDTQFGGDAHAYWSIDLANLYGRTLNVQDAYLYAPPFAFLISPLLHLSWNAFYVVWTALQHVPLVLSMGPIPAALGEQTFIGLRTNLFSGNIHIWTAAMILVGFRWPGVWSAQLLTKVVPGVAILWFVVRGEWRAVRIVALTTAAIVLVTLPFGPRLWIDWINVLVGSGGSVEHGLGKVIIVPLTIRGPIALAIVIVGARWDQRWMLPIAVMLAHPVIWRSGPAILIAVVPLYLADRHPDLVARAIRAHPWWTLVLAPWVVLLPETWTRWRAAIRPECRHVMATGA